MTVRFIALFRPFVTIVAVLLRGGAMLQMV